MYKRQKWSFAIIGAISTIMGVAGVSLIDLLPKDSGCPFRLFVLVILFVLLAFFAAIVTYHHNKDGVHLVINGMDVDIVVDDLFCTEGVKVIPFNEYFDIKVDDRVISKNSLNGIFIEMCIRDRLGLPMIAGSDAHERAVECKKLFSGLETGALLSLAGYYLKTDMTAKSLLAEINEVLDSVAESYPVLLNGFTFLMAGDAYDLEKYGTFCCTPSDIEKLYCREYELIGLSLIHICLCL